MPSSLLRFNAAKLGLKILPVDLQIHGYPVAIVTLKNRLLSPLASFFMAHVRDVAASVASSSHSNRA